MSGDYLKNYYEQYAERLLASLKTELRPKAEPGGPKPPTLRDRIVADLKALGVSFAKDGPKELPEPERDLSRYEDALAVARESCPHNDAVELLYRREWVCDDCGRILHRADMKKRNPFFGGWLFS